MSKNELENITLYKAVLVDGGNETPSEIQIEKSGDWYNLTLDDAVRALINGLPSDDIANFATGTDTNIAIVGITIEGCPDEVIASIPKEYVDGKSIKPFRVDISNLKTAVSVLSTKITECDIDAEIKDNGKRVVNIKKLVLTDNVSKAEYTLF